MRVYPSFLQKLPGVEVSDSIAYRIEALRVFLEMKLTEDIFVHAYKLLQSGSSDSQDLENLLGEHMNCLGLIH